MKGGDENVLWHSVVSSSTRGRRFCVSTVTMLRSGRGPLAARGCKSLLIIRLWMNELDHVEIACYYVTGDGILEVDVVSIRFDA